MKTRIQPLIAASLVCFLYTACSFAATVRYSYDAAGRLVNADYGDASIAYMYDPAGNVLATTVTPVARERRDVEKRLVIPTSDVTPERNPIGQIDVPS